MVSSHVVNGSWLTKSQYCMKQFCNAFVFASATIGNQTEHKFQIPLAADSSNSFLLWNSGNITTLQVLSYYTRVVSNDDDNYDNSIDDITNDNDDNNKENGKDNEVNNKNNNIHEKITRF